MAGVGFTAENASIIDVPPSQAPTERPSQLPPSQAPTDIFQLSPFQLTSNAEHITNSNIGSPAATPRLLAVASLLQSPARVLTSSPRRPLSPRQLLISPGRSTLAGPTLAVPPNPFKGDAFEQDALFTGQSTAVAPNPVQHASIGSSLHPAHPVNVSLDFSVGGSSSTAPAIHLLGSTHLAAALPRPGTDWPSLVFSLLSQLDVPLLTLPILPPPTAADL